MSPVRGRAHEVDGWHTLGARPAFELAALSGIFKLPDITPVNVKKPPDGTQWERTRHSSTKSTRVASRLSFGPRFSMSLDASQTRPLPSALMRLAYFPRRARCPTRGPCGSLLAMRCGPLRSLMGWALARGVLGTGSAF